MERKEMLRSVAGLAIIIAGVFSGCKPTENEKVVGGDTLEIAGDKGWIKGRVVRVSDDQFLARSAGNGVAMPIEEVVRFMKGRGCKISDISFLGQDGWSVRVDKRLPCLSELK